MTTWTRARIDVLCGRCGELVLKGQFLLELTLKGTRMKNGEPVGVIDVGRKLTYCLQCGERQYGAPPEDLPPLVECPAIQPQILTRFSPNMLPLDWKVKQAGDREPGEEG